MVESILLWEIKDREWVRERERERERESYLGYCQTLTIESLVKLINDFLQNTLSLMFGRVLNRCL